MKFKKISRVIALFLAIITLFLSVPITTDAAVATDVPYPMRSNFVLDALQYLGYDVQKLKNNGKLYQEGWYGAKLLKQTNGESYLSDIIYDVDGSLTGLGTKDGKPNVDSFESYGLNCASFVTYVYLNYLPNVAKKADGSSYKNDSTYQYIKNAVTNYKAQHGYSYQADELWQRAFSAYANNKEIRKYSANFSSSEIKALENGTGASYIKALNLESLLKPGAMISMGRLNTDGSVKDWTHVAIYLGTYNGKDFVAHCTGGAQGERRSNGDGRGPEISTLQELYSRQSDDKFSYPIEFFNIEWFQEYGKIQIQKTSHTGQSLAGAEFTIKNNSTNEGLVVITNSKGSAETPEIPFGTYTVTETNFPAGYGEHTMEYNGSTYKGKSITVTLNSSTKNATIQIKAVNKKLVGGIYGYKTYWEPTANNGAGGHLGLSGATIGLFSDSECKNLLQRCTTGQNVTLPDGSKHNGGYVFRELEVDKTYYIKEIESPPGFELCDTVATIKLTEGGKYVMVSGNQAIIDEKSPGGIYGYKTYYEPTADSGAGGHLGLSGATIGLFSDKACKNKLQECVTGQIMPNNNTYHKGGYVFKDLEVDKTYYIKEITPPPGFELSISVPPCL